MGRCSAGGASRAARAASRPGIGDGALDEAGRSGFGHRWPCGHPCGGSMRSPHTISRYRPECRQCVRRTLSGPSPAVAALGVARRRRASLCLTGSCARCAVRSRPGGAARPCPSSTLPTSTASPGSSKRCRQGGRAQLLGHLVRAVPAGDAVARCRWRRSAAAEGWSVGAVNYKESGRRRSGASSSARRSRRRSCSIPTATPTSDWTPRVFPSTVLIGRNGKPAHIVRRRPRLDGQRRQGAARAARWPRA